MVDLLLANDEEAVEYVFFHRCNRMFAHIDVNNCIKNLDNFFKSEKVSEDLKKYMLNATDRLSDLWFVHMNLGTKEITADNLLYPCPIY